MGNNGDIRRQAWRSHVALEASADEAVLSLDGRFGQAAAGDLARAAAEVLALSHRRVVLDVGSVDYISSPCLHIIDRLTRDLASANRSLVVRQVSDPVRLVLELSGVAQRLHIEPR